MPSDVIKLFRKMAPLSQEEECVIETSFKSLIIPKDQFFLKAGEVNTHIGFLKKGLVRYFVFKNEDEATFEFTKEGEFVSDYQSFSLNKPSIQNIQAIEDCEFLIINYSDVQTIFNNTTHGNLLGRIIIEHRFEVMINQLLSIYMHSQEERYIKFINDYSDLSQRIPQYLIASYVGIKPESLSRMRKRFTKRIS